MACIGSLLLPGTAPFDDCRSRTPRRAPARVAFEAGAVAKEREVAAFLAGFAFIALGLGFGAFLRGHSSRGSASVSNIGAGFCARLRFRQRLGLLFPLLRR